jgi:hypothetical protein
MALGQMTLYVAKYLGKQSTHENASKLDVSVACIIFIFPNSLQREHFLLRGVTNIYIFMLIISAKYVFKNES